MNSTTIAQGTLLVVDDQEMNVFVLRSILDEQHRVLVAGNGREALTLSGRERPDLILLDIVMPGMDGIQVCRALKQSEATRDIPVIFVTSQDSPEEETRGLEAGAVDFISRPINASVVLARVRTHLTLKRQQDFLKSQVFVDSLTGAFNRRRFDEYLQFEWHRSTRNASPIGLLMIDVDNFKHINDTYGHVEGDATLVRIVQNLQRNLKRSQDLVARVGGDELVCLIPDAEPFRVQALAERLVESVAATRFEPVAGQGRIPVSVSIGYVTVVPGAGESPQQLIVVADQMLYRAKNNGRNQAYGEVCLYQFENQAANR